MEKQVWLIDERGGLWRQEGEKKVPGEAKEAKKGYVATVLPTSDFHSHTFKLPLSTAEERFATVVEITMFEESGLDVAKEYVVSYTRHRLSYEEAWLVEAFAAESEKLQTRYGALAGEIGHIDLVTIPYVVYEGLYLSGDLKAEGNDLIVRIGESESLALLYKDGRYIAHRSLPTVASMALKGQVTPSVIMAMLAEKGLDASAYALEESLAMTAIRDALETAIDRIVQTVNHKRGIFGISSVDRIYLDFEGGKIPGLWTLFDEYGFAESDKRLLTCGGRTWPEAEVETCCALRYAEAAAEGRIEEPVNLTIFERKPAFLSTAVGRFVAAVAVAMLLVAGGGGYLTWRLDTLKQQRQGLEKEYGKIARRATEMKNRLKALRQRREALRKQVENGEREIDAYDEAADVMELIVASKLKRRQMIKDVDEALARERISAVSMEQNGSKRMAIEVLVPYKERDRVARFMGHLIDMGYTGVQTDLISLDKDVYRSVVEIVR